MDLEITLALSLAVLAACVFFGWSGMRPPNPARGPRLIPHRLLMILAAGVLIVLLAHLLGLVVGGPG